MRITTGGVRGQPDGLPEVGQHRRGAGMRRAARRRAAWRPSRAQAGPPGERFQGQGQIEAGAGAASTTSPAPAGAGEDRSGGSAMKS